MDEFLSGVEDVTDLMRVAERDTAVTMLTDLLISVYRLGKAHGMEKNDTPSRSSV